MSPSQVPGRSLIYALLSLALLLSSVAAHRSTWRTAVDHLVFRTSYSRLVGPQHFSVLAPKFLGFIVVPMGFFIGISSIFKRKGRGLGQVDERHKLLADERQCVQALKADPGGADQALEAEIAEHGEVEGRSRKSARCSDP